MASGISPVLVSCSLAEHARVNLPGIDDWDNGTSREAVDRRTFGPSEAAGCWEGSEGEESDEDDCTPAWSPFASEAAPAASARSAAIFLQPSGALSGCWLCASAACNFIKLPYELIDVRVRVRVMSFIDELTTSSSS